MNLYVLDHATTFDPVGFSAYAESNQGYNYRSPVNFTGLITNAGNSYHPSNSSFVCPYAGVYLFSLTIQTDDDYTSEYKIMKDNTIVATAAEYSYIHYPTGASVIIIECVSGERVWVRIGDRSAYLMGGTDRQSIFSGYMLYQYD